MKGIKRVVSLILIAFVVMTIIFNVTAKSVKAQDENFKWLYKETADGIVINGYEGWIKDDIIIPSVIDGKRVVEFNIGFDYFKQINSLYIPASVEKVSPFLLMMLVIKDDIKVDKDNKNYSSEDGLLYNKDKTELIKGTNRECIKLPEGLKVIDDCAFNRCNNLANAILPESLNKLGKNSFCETAMKNIYLPDNLTDIGRYSFGGCESLTYVHLPENLKTLHYGTFFGCKNLKSIKIPDCMKEIENSAFSELGLCKIEIGDNLNELGPEVFEDVEDLKEIYLPSSVNDLGYHCFNGDDITIYASNNSYVENYAKDNGIKYINGVYTDNNIHEYTLKDYGKTFYKLDDNGNAVIVGCSDDAQKIGIPDTIDGHKVISIANHAFCDNKNITSVRIDSKLDSIGDYAFAGCSNLSDFTCYNPVKNLGKYLFCNCTNLKIVDDEFLDDISEGEFYNCTNLDYNYILKYSSAINIGDYAFVNSKTSNGLELSRTKNIGKYAFYGSEYLGNVNLLSIVEIGDYAFSKCNNITKVNCFGGNENTYTIGKGAFSSDYNLETVSLEPNASYIGDYAFSNCPNLKTVDIADSSQCKLGNNIYEDSNNVQVDYPIKINSMNYTATHVVNNFDEYNFDVNACGNGGLTYRFIVYKDYKLIYDSDYTESNKFTFKPSESGDYIIRCIIRDSYGLKKIIQKEINIRVTPETIKCNIKKISPNLAKSKVKLSITTSGMTNAKYRFVVLKDGKNVYTRGYGIKNYTYFKPSERGTYTIYFIAKDEIGREVRKVVNYEV